MMPYKSMHKPASEADPAFEALQHLWEETVISEQLVLLAPWIWICASQHSGAHCASGS
jgi:hypothetical protein